MDANTANSLLVVEGVLEEQKKHEKVATLILEVMLLAVDTRHSIHRMYSELIPMIGQFVQRVITMNKDYCTKTGRLLDAKLFQSLHCMLFISF
jgi:hypothetical protein